MSERLFLYREIKEAIIGCNTTGYEGWQINSALSSAVIHARKNAGEYWQPATAENNRRLYPIGHVVSILDELRDLWRISGTDEMLNNAEQSLIGRYELSLKRRTSPIDEVEECSKSPMKANSSLFNETDSLSF